MKSTWVKDFIFYLLLNTYVSLWTILGVAVSLPHIQSCLFSNFSLMMHHKFDSFNCRGRDISVRGPQGLLMFSITPRLKISHEQQ